MTLTRFGTEFEVLEIPCCIAVTPYSPWVAPPLPRHAAAHVRVFVEADGAAGRYPRLLRPRVHLSNIRFAKAPDPAGVLAALREWKNSF